MDRKFEFNKPKTIKMDTSAKIINNRIYIPLRSFVELLYGEVKWDGKNRVVTINNNAAG
ncbi:MAG TPA: stalk domain-containing protein [Pseudobacteroides sp.]|nr:stalk domain-containing protein [Pseudobacteroides sp.]